MDTAALALILQASGPAAPAEGTVDPAQHPGLAFGEPTPEGELRADR